MHVRRNLPRGGDNVNVGDVSRRIVCVQSSKSEVVGCSRGNFILVLRCLARLGSMVVG